MVGQVTTLMSAAKPITNTVGIALVVFSIYGILGMQFLLGRMGACSDPIVWRKEECAGVDALGVPLIWRTHPVNFDNLYRAIVAMFILATQDDWQGHMVDPTPPGLPCVPTPHLHLKFLIGSSCFRTLLLRCSPSSKVPCQRLMNVICVYLTCRLPGIGVRGRGGRGEGEGFVLQWAGIDSTTKLTGPVENNNPMYALFYLGAIVVAGYLVINIFVGVFVDSYNLAAEKMGRDEIAKPEPPAKLAPLDEDDDDGMRGKVVEVVTNTNFDLFIAFFIVTNVITMAFESFKQVLFHSLCAPCSVLCCHQSA